MIVEPLGAFAPPPALITSTVDVFTSNGAFTVTTGLSPATPVTVTASNLSADAPAGAANASGVAHTATSARTARRRRTEQPFVRGGGKRTRYRRVWRARSRGKALRMAAGSRHDPIRTWEDAEAKTREFQGLLRKYRGD